MSKNKSNILTKENNTKAKIHPDIERKFRILLKIMSWVVGISFLLIIILPLFEFNLVDIIVKSLYFTGIINLILFAILEYFAQNIKIILSKNKI